MSTTDIATRNAILTRWETAYSDYNEGKTLSPSTSDLVQDALQVLGIADLEQPIFDSLVEDLYEYSCEGHDLGEKVDHLVDAIDRLAA